MRQARRVTFSDLDDAERATLLEADVRAVLAFVDSSGFPRIAPCWFPWDGEAFYVTSLADKFHVRGLRKTPVPASASRSSG